MQFTEEPYLNAALRVVPHVNVMERLSVHWTGRNRLGLSTTKEDFTIRALITHRHTTPLITTKTGTHLDPESRASKKEPKKCCLLSN